MSFAVSACNATRSTMNVKMKMIAAGKRRNSSWEWPSPIPTRKAWVGRRDEKKGASYDAFLALHQHLASIDTSQLPSWLFTVVRNRARDYWQRQGR